MKELTEKKELDAATFDNSRLPLHECEFWDKDGVVFLGTLRAIQGGMCPFIRWSGGEFSKCAQVIKRYPRDVPEDVTPLPDDKPFLAYITEWSFDKIHILEAGELYFWDLNEWRPCDGYNPYYDHFAIDVSTAWAQKNFPEIVEAMEYRPVFSSDESDYGKKSLVGHELDGIHYDLEWGKVESEVNLHLTPDDVFGVEPAEIEPPDFDELLRQKRITGEDEPPGEDMLRIVYYAGYVRAKWDARQWKYKTWKDIPVEYEYRVNADGFKKAVVKAARELEGEG